MKYGKTFVGLALAFAATLGLSSAAKGSMIYSGVLNQTKNSGESYDLTRAGQTTPDFTLSAFGPSGYGWNVNISTPAGNKIAGYTNSDGRYATALAEASQINASAAWVGDATHDNYLFYHTFFGYSGDWLDGSNHLVGLAFNLGDGTHYGWARVSTTATSTPSALSRL